ncbi:MAG: ATP-NAD kinase family protein [Promethearchaeota archaeon]
MSGAEFSIGFVVNPYAGMGGAVGLKGTDGEEILEKAISLGAKPQASKRGLQFLQKLAPISNRTKLITASGGMGASCLEKLEFTFKSIEVIPVPRLLAGKRSTSEDTKNFVMQVKPNVDIIVFVGGDGTARDVFQAISTNDAGSTTPVLGIPAGVKIHSGVFSINPEAAALLVLRFLSGEIGTREAEVMDIDEDGFRNNQIRSKLYGYLQVPYNPAFVQGTKQGSPMIDQDEDNKERIANYLVRNIEPDVCYFIGPGSTTKPILDKLNLDKTLLGIDAVINKKLVKKDLNAQDLLELLDKNEKEGRKSKIILTVIGAQGFLFGRGNLQFTPEIIRKVGLENIIIVMTRYKLSTLPNGKMKNDTRDPKLDAEMRGYYRVLIDDGEYKIIELE